MRRAAAVALSALTAVGALVGTVAPASAESGTAPDPAGDIQFFDARDAGQLRSDYVDITSTTADHRDNTVVVTVSILDVDRRTTFEVQGALKAGGDLYLARLRNTAAGVDLALLRGDSTIPCDGLRGAVKQDASEVVLRVPRVCLGRPDTVRFGSRTVGMGDGLVVVDDGRRQRPVDTPATPIRIGRRSLAQG